jgi:hypothetical protein
METNQELLTFFKTMSDVDRLKVVGELAKGPAPVSELASKTGLPPSDILRHLEQLQNAGFVTVQDADSKKAAYALATEHLPEMAKQQALRARKLNPEPDERLIGEHFTAGEVKIIRTFTDNRGIITQIPMGSYKKNQPLMRYALQFLEQGRQYSEKEITEALKQISHDPAYIRRFLVDEGYLLRERDGSVYQRVEGRK